VPANDIFKPRAAGKTSENSWSRLSLNDLAICMIDLTGKTALVTGATDGIGKATAHALAGLGANVLMHYDNDASTANAIASSIRAEGGRAIALAGDLASPDGPPALARQVRSVTGDRLDILVNSADFLREDTFDSATPEDFEAMFAMNVRAPIFLLQCLLPALTTGASVVFVSSLMRRHATGLHVAYAISKGAIETAVHHLAAALGPRDIRVNAVAPGAIETNACVIKGALGNKGVLALQALQRFATPEDIADVIAFLSSNDARWMSGAIIPVDGGSKL
jgi:NAD(P)-dependent dehydrogenase (short-subunit alcohol dehydrogenase family)